jgi:phosphoserine phosphatase
MTKSNSDDDESFQIIVKDPNFQLSLRSQFTQLSPITKIARWKDERLKLVNISKGLIEALQDAGFTIEKIIESGPSNIAERLGIDEYVAQIIFRETKKITSKIMPTTLINYKL